MSLSDGIFSFILFAFGDKLVEKEYDESEYTVSQKGIEKVKKKAKRKFKRKPECFHEEIDDFLTALEEEFLITVEREKQLLSRPIIIEEYDFFREFYILKKEERSFSKYGKFEDIDYCGFCDMVYRGEMPIEVLGRIDTVLSRNSIGEISNYVMKLFFPKALLVRLIINNQHRGKFL